VPKDKQGRFDLKGPCKNCPFRKDEHGIRFYDQTRAIEIYFTVLRHGFPCHKSATDEQPWDDGDSSGYVFAKDGSTQFCGGALQMLVNEGHRWTDTVSEDALNAFRERSDGKVECFSGLAEMVQANTGLTK